MITIRFIKTEETYNIRKKVLRKNIDLPYQLEGDFDEDSFHLGLFVNNELASIVTFLKKDYNKLTGEQFQLRAMATLEKYRGNGYGKMLVEHAEHILLNKNIHLIWCKARVNASEFYKSLKYKILGNVFEVPKVGKHYMMYKELK